MDLNTVIQLANNGDSNAQFELGEKYYEGNGVEINKIEAFKWYKKSAFGGNLDAIQMLGVMLLDDDVIPNDLKKSLQLFNHGAEKGHIGCINMLADMYYIGQGVKKDIFKALEFYKTVANEGSITAQYKLGNEYYYGKNITKDDNSALKWYKKATEQGHLDAEYMMEKLLGIPHKTKLDPTCEHYMEECFGEEQYLEFYGWK